MVHHAHICRVSINVWSPSRVTRGLAERSSHGVRVGLQACWMGSMARIPARSVAARVLGTARRSASRPLRGRRRLQGCPAHGRRCGSCSWLEQSSAWQGSLQTIHTRRGQQQKADMAGCVP